MPVSKYVINKQSNNFTTIPNKVLQNLRDMESLGLYAYLCSLPIGWEFYKSQIRKHTNMGIQKLDRNIKTLKDHNLIKIKQHREETGRFSSIEMFIMDGNEFKNKELQVHNHNNRSMESIHTDTETYKYNIDKYNIDKKNIDKNNAQHKKRVAFDPEKIDLPNWLQKELWIDFVQHRISIKKPLTELAAKKTISLLTKMKESGQDIEVVINTSIANGWQGLFEIKSQRSSYGKDSKYHGKNGKFDSTQYLLDSIRLDEIKESNPLPESSLSFQDCQYLQYDGTGGDRY